MISAKKRSDLQWIAFDLPHQVLPDVQLNGRVTINALADLAVNAVPALTKFAPQETPQRRQILVEVFAIVLPRPANPLAAGEIFHRDALPLPRAAARE